MVFCETTNPPTAVCPDPTDPEVVVVLVRITPCPDEPETVVWPVSDWFWVVMLVMLVVMVVTLIWVTLV